MGTTETTSFLTNQSVFGDHQTRMPYWEKIVVMSRNTIYFSIFVSSVSLEGLIFYPPWIDISTAVRWSQHPGITTHAAHSRMHDLRNVQVARFAHVRCSVQESAGNRWWSRCYADCMALIGPIIVTITLDNCYNSYDDVIKVTSHISRAIFFCFWLTLQFTVIIINIALSLS